MLFPFFLMWRDCKVNYCKLLSSLSCVSPVHMKQLRHENWMSTIHTLRDRGSRGYERIIFYLWLHWECVNLVKWRLSYRHADVNNASHVGKQGSMGIISSELTLVQSPTWLSKTSHYWYPARPPQGLGLWSDMESSSIDSETECQRFKGNGTKKEVNEDTEKDRRDKI